MAETLLKGSLVTLAPGLERQEANMKTLNKLYENLQLVSIDTDPYEDIYSFASRAVYFAPIHKTTDILQPPKTAPPPVPPLNIYNKPLRNYPVGGCWPKEYVNDKEAMQATDWLEPTSPVDKWLSPDPLHTSTMQSTSFSFENEDYPQPIGLLYLMLTPTHTVPVLGAGELTIGLILDTDFQGVGYGKEALQLAVQHGFDFLNAHRIQALLIDSYSKNRALGLFTSLHFGHEGIRRRAFYSPVEQEWKDVTCLAVLATDWINRSYMRAIPLTLWDEMLARHQKERESLLRWDESQRRLQRTASMETIRGATDTVPESDNESVVSAVAADRSMASGLNTLRIDDPFETTLGNDSVDKGKRKFEDDSQHYEASDAEDDSDAASFHSSLSRTKYRRLDDSPPPSPTLSQYSSASSVPVSEVESESQWEQLDASSSPAWSANEESDWE